MPNIHQRMIAGILSDLGVEGVDPRHVEAFMRIEHGTLGGLSEELFREEVVVGVECVRTGGVANAEAVAASFGL